MDKNGVDFSPYLNERGVVDVRYVNQGRDYDIFFQKKDGTFARFATATSAKLTMSTQTNDITPAGDIQSQAMVLGISYNFNVSELVIVATQSILEEFMAAMNTRKWADFTFQSVIHNPDGTETRCVVPNCVLSGDIDVFGFESGQASTRSYTFRVNGTPKFYK